MKYKEIQGESNIEKRLQLQYLTKLGKISDKIFSLMKNGATTTDDGDTLYTLRQQWTTTQSDISQLFQGKSIGTLQTQENTIEKMLLLQNFIEELKRLKSNLEDEIKGSDAISSPNKTKEQVKIDKTINANLSEVKNMLFDMGILVTPEEYISKEEYDKIVKIFNDKISSLPIEDISCLRGKILQVKETKFTIPEIDEVKYQDRGYIFLILLKNIIKRHPKYEEEILGLGLKGNISRK